MFGHARVRPALLAIGATSAVDVNGESTSDGAQIIQWPYHGGANQQWRFTPVGAGRYELVNLTPVNRASGLLADVNGASTVQGAAVVGWAANGGADQQWQLQFVS